MTERKKVAPTAPGQVKSTKCAGIQINSRAEDFGCDHHQASVHVHTRPDGSTVRWADPSVPRGMRRKRPYKKYSNPKLTRQSVLPKKKGISG